MSNARCPNPDCLCNYEPAIEGVTTVSAWEGSKFQEAVEDEKKYGRKRPDPRTVTPLHKYNLGDYLAYNRQGGEVIAKVKAVKAELTPHYTWAVFYQLKSNWVAESDITRRLVEAP